MSRCGSLIRLLESKSVADIAKASGLDYADDYLKIAQKWLSDAQTKSLAYQDYIEWVIYESHVMPSSESVFESYLESKKSELSLDDVNQALEDLWPDSDEDAKLKLIYKAKTLGIK